MIEIKLLSNRRFIYANRNQNIVITAENNATEIMVEFPDDYIKHSKRVDFVNSQGKTWTEALFVPEYKQYAADFNQLIFTFTLPNEVTTPGELKMQFIAYKPDESLTVVPFEVVPIYVDEAMACFKKNSKSNPDLLIMSYNQSTEALFLAQQSKGISKAAEEKIGQTVKESEDAKTEAAKAIKAAAEAKKIAGDTKGKLSEASDSAAEAKLNSERAVKTAEEARANIAEIQNSAEQAKNSAAKAVVSAQAAEEKATALIGASEQANAKADSALITATQAKQSAEAADRKADNVLTASEQAKAAAQSAESKAARAKSTADAVTLKIDAAKSQADYAKNRSEYATERADEAVSIANDATALATQAKNKANQAEQSAQLVHNLVSTAISDAENAMAVAKGIDAKANDAIGKAQSANETSAKAESKADTAIAEAREAKSFVAGINDISQSVEETAKAAVIKAEEAVGKAAKAETKAAESEVKAAQAIQMAEAAAQTAVEVIDIAAEAAAKSAIAASKSVEAERYAEQVYEAAVSADGAAKEAKSSAEEAAAKANEIESGFAVFKREIEVSLEKGSETGTGYFTPTEKDKLAGIEQGAQKNVQPDWNEKNENVAGYIRNKPEYTAENIGAATKEQGEKADNAEPAFEKNTAFNKYFGKEEGTVCEGNDERLSDPREPKAHTHDASEITGLNLNENQEPINIPAWAQQPNKPTYTADEVGAATAAQGTKADNAVPNTRKINGKALSGDITLTAAELGINIVAEPGESTKDLMTQKAVSNLGHYKATGRVYTQSIPAYNKGVYGNFYAHSNSGQKIMIKEKTDKLPLNALYFDLQVNFCDVDLYINGVKTRAFEYYVQVPYDGYYFDYQWRKVDEIYDYYTYGERISINQEDEVYAIITKGHDWFGIIAYDDDWQYEDDWDEEPHFYYSISIAVDSVAYGTVLHESTAYLPKEVELFDVKLKIGSTYYTIIENCLAVSNSNNTANYYGTGTMSIYYGTGILSYPYYIRLYAWLPGKDAAVEVIINLNNSVFTTTTAIRFEYKTTKPKIMRTSATTTAAAATTEHASGSTVTQKAHGLLYNPVR